MAYERFSLGRHKGLFDSPDYSSGFQLPEEPPEDDSNNLFRSSRLTTPYGLGQDELFPQRRFDPTSVQQEELPKPPAPTFAEAYAQKARNPEYERIRTMIDSAPKKEDYKPTKWSRLAASMVGFSTGWNNPQKGREAYESRLNRSYNEAESEYDKKLRNVSALAGMKGEDIKNELRGMELGQQFSDTSADRAQRQREADANQKYREDSLKAQGWDFYTDEITGKRLGYNSVTHENKELGQIAESRVEKTKREADVAKALADARANEQRIAATSRENVANTRATSAAANLRARAQLLKPGDINIKANNDLAAIADIYDLSVADMEKYVDKDEATGRLFVNDDRTGKWIRNDTPRDLEIKAAMRRVLANTYGGGDNKPVSSHETKSSGKWSVEEVTPTKGKKGEG